eukprot:TRINITY_DN4357_c0_g1_i3.p1 TRINITY_DN4357_c0_g1~~TRINITY_DN4357_c0_g1_i3.p1  ORF type:complete len:200 (+),score=35.08 TRINITY_DN4357_c0_g1_i3:155-754(+)
MVRHCVNFLKFSQANKLESFNRQPKLRIQKLENIMLAFGFIKNEGIMVVGIGPEDLADGHLKLTLGLLWTLILRYHVTASEDGSPKHDLLKWVNSKIERYHLKDNNNVKNFTTDWQDGTVLFALTDSLQPGVLTSLDMYNLSGVAIDDVQKAMDTAEQVKGIPKLLEAADLVNSPDELSLMTYISYFRSERRQNQNTSL